MEGDADGEDEPPALRRFERLVYAYFAALVVLMLALMWLLGPLAGGGLVLVGHLLLHAPAFAVRGDLRLRADRSPDAVRAELAAPRESPLTSLWLAKADSVSESGDEDPAARFTVSGPLGVQRRQYAVDVDERPGGLRLAIRRDQPVLIADVSVEAAGDGATVTVTADRPRVHAFSLFLMRATESAIARHLLAAGYELVEEETDLRLRSPFR